MAHIPRYAPDTCSAALGRGVLRVNSQVPVTNAWQKHAIRGDIQGLRALAVLLVLIFHLWPSALPGGYIGVDVFFVISGYLIVGSLAKEFEREGKVSLLDFYRRRARRLVPAALVVLGVVLVTTIFWLPQARWEDNVFQVLSSALYVQNWFLAWSSVDYLAAENAPSPVLHYWSLSIEEQFYIFWPILMLAIGWIVNRLKLASSTVVGLVLLCVFFASLVASIVITGVAPAQAYFFSHTRFWEIAFGGLLAIWLPKADLTPSSRLVLFAAGLMMILAASFTYGNVAFPGWSALVPVMGAGFILVAGPFRIRGFGGLDVQPFRYVGDISYSVYLWHWPIIVFYTAWNGEVGLADGVLLLFVALFVSHLSYRHVEERFRHRKVTLTMGPLGASFAGAALVAGLSLMLYVGISAARPEAPDAARAPDMYPGPAALLSAATVPDGVKLLPAPAHLLRDRSPVYDSGCHQDMRSAEVTTCILGAGDADFTVAVIGSSHSVNWLPAIDVLGRRNGWRIVSMTKSACGMHSVRPEACNNWHDGVMAYLRGSPPDLVFVGESTDQHAGDEMQGRVAERLERITRLGIPVIAFRPTPRLRKPPADCLPDRVDECDVPRSDALGHNVFELAESRLANVYVVDMTDGICDASTCSAVVGNIVVFRDRHHLTATYARALAPYLEQRIAGLGANLAPINDDPWDNSVVQDNSDRERALLRCGGYRTGSPPFARTYNLEYEGGRVILQRGDVENKERNFEVWSGEVKRDIVKITGNYRDGPGGVKSVEFVGTVIDGVLVAGGKRGPRICSVYWSPSNDLFETSLTAR